MAGKAFSGDEFSSNVAGLSKHQLYDIMSQMKTLIEQNQQQARQILIQNPTLTRALFQAQIMLGMLHPPRVVPNRQPAELRHPQKSVQPAPQQSSETSQSMSVQDSLMDISVSQTQIPFRKQQQNQPAIMATSSTGPTANLQSMPMPSHAPHTALQPKERPSDQPIHMSVSQSSHIPDVHLFPHHSGSMPHSLHQPQMFATSSQLQQPLPTTAIPYQPLQLPLPQQSRHPSMQIFHHQLPSQMSSNLGFQHPGPPQMHHSQPMFHSGLRPPPMIGPPFQQGQSALPPQLPPQTGGSHMVGDFGNSAGKSMRVERGGPSWMPGPPENTTGSQLSGLPPFPTGLMGPGNQPPRPAPLAPDLEKALLQQVMSLTQEQINLLPPEQRNQVFQLQQMLRQ